MALELRQIRSRGWELGSRVPGKRPGAGSKYPQPQMGMGQDPKDGWVSPFACVRTGAERAAGSIPGTRGEKLRGCVPEASRYP